MDMYFKIHAAVAHVKLLLSQVIHSNIKFTTAGYVPVGMLGFTYCRESASCPKYQDNKLKPISL